MNEDLGSHNYYHIHQSKNHNYHIMNLYSMLFIIRLPQNIIHPLIQYYPHITPLFGAYIPFYLILLHYPHHHLTIVHLNHPIILTEGSLRS